MEAAQGFLVNLGLGDVAIRGLIGFLAGTIGVFILKPDFAFHKDTVVRPKKFPSETYFPWWMIGLIATLVFTAV